MFRIALMVLLLAFIPSSYGYNAGVLPKMPKYGKCERPGCGHRTTRFFRLMKGDQRAKFWICGCCNKWAMQNRATIAKTLMNRAALYRALDRTTPTPKAPKRRSRYGPWQD